MDCPVTKKNLWNKSKYVKTVILSIEEQASQDHRHWDKGKTLGEPYCFPSFVSGTDPCHHTGVGNPSRYTILLSFWWQRLEFVAVLSSWNLQDRVSEKRKLHRGSTPEICVRIHHGSLAGGELGLCKARGRETYQRSATGLSSDARGCALLWDVGILPNQRLNKR